MNNKQMMRDVALEKSLFRMNFIIQDNAATTLESNLIKIVEAVLYDSVSELDLYQISEKIKDYCDLSFSPAEIDSAIKKKGNSRSFFKIPSMRACSIPLIGNTGAPLFSSTPTMIYPPPMLSMSLAKAQMERMIGSGLKSALYSIRAT